MEGEVHTPGREPLRLPLYPCVDERPMLSMITAVANSNLQQVTFITEGGWGSYNCKHAQKVIIIY